LVAFVGVAPLIIQANEREAWNTIKDPKNSGVRAAIELLRQGCWAKSKWSWMPDFLTSSPTGVTYETFDLHDGNSPSTQSTKKENWTTWKN
jgi:hypothetical protein